MDTEENIRKVCKMCKKTVFIFMLVQVLVSTYAQGMIETNSRAMPIQMDMNSEGDITICTGLKRYIACRDGTNIAVTNAFWGRTSDKVCPSDDGDPVTDCEGSDETLSLVKKYCEAKNECKLEAKHGLLQKNGTHHCPGVNKYLIVNYTCIPESKGVTLCDSAESTLNCKAGWVMELADIFWGRRSSSKYCGTEEGMECDLSESASKYLKNQCNGKRTCLVKADSNVLDNSHSQCASMLKYLMVNYICKPGKGASYAEEKDDKDDDDDNKILQDTSSKELMGLLEKHLNEIKTPDAKENAKITEDKKVEVKQYNSLAKGSTKSNNAKPKVRATVGKSTTNFVATEDDDITKTLLNAPAFTRNLKKEETTTTSSMKVAKKSEEPERVESPASDVKAEVHATTTEQETPGKNTNSAKDKVPKATESESFELSEPSTVRSILQRAKEVLKTLDSDSTGDDEIKKRGDIAHASSTAAAAKKSKTADKDFNKVTANAVKQVAKLAQSLVTNVATKGVKSKKSTQPKSASNNIQKPKPGFKRSGYRGTGTAGIGNTP